MVMYVCVCVCVWSSVYVIYLQWCIILQGFLLGYKCGRDMFAKVSIQCNAIDDR